MAAAPPAGYSRLQIRLHWAVVALVVLQYALHDGVASAFDRGMEAGALTLSAPAVGHFVAGSAIFLLAAWRLLLRQERGAPAPPAEDPPWQRGLARSTHAAMYALMLGLPVTGGVAWAMASEGASTAHEVMRALLLLAIVLHVAGAIYGQVVQKTGAIDRMRRPVD
ncbi:cytochrome B [Rhodovulum sp. 12E13]|uniref:cytochrome b n=1 Tax=Rhodovulum sp. 12E13 TaxID=2203891 RepID=UPI000E148887|nr:cytochrome b/b6 domain-containing protein [Rhodovulum sp. 12E13]RDC70946.1 cytochrome B [Rhodovulum sp. 12E13]